MQVATDRRPIRAQPTPTRASRSILRLKLFKLLSGRARGVDGPWANASSDRDAAEARSLLEQQAQAITTYGLGSLAEIFDAEPPFTPGGCIAQAWTVGELIRCWKLLS